MSKLHSNRSMWVGVRRVSVSLLATSLGLSMIVTGNDALTATASAAVTIHRQPGT